MLSKIIKYDYYCPQCFRYVVLKINPNPKFEWDVLQGYCEWCHIDINKSWGDYFKWVEESHLEIIEDYTEPDF